MKVPSLLTAFLALAAPLGGQAPTLRVEAGSEPVNVPAALHRGHAAYPATALAPFGAKVEVRPDGASLLLFGDTLVFETLSPFFRAGGRLYQLSVPVYREGGVLYLPHQVFTEWLPARYAGRLEFRGGALRAARRPETRTAVRPAATARADESANGKGNAPSPRPRAAQPAARGGRSWGAPGERNARVVVLDAGHGGRDPGKVGPNGSREKDVALAITRRLGEILRERGYEVHLTRARDTLIALADRPRFANRWKAGRPAALFMSIHANSGPGAAEGFETYFLSEARTDDERRVAEMENAAVEFEEEAGEPVPELDHILQNLRNDFYLHASHDLAQVSQRQIRTLHPGPNRGVKQAGFRVLVGAIMPAVLVETAFISNDREARLLATAAFQQKLARALADAVEQFFASHEHLWTTTDTN